MDEVDADLCVYMYNCQIVLLIEQLFRSNSYEKKA